MLYTKLCLWPSKQSFPHLTLSSFTVYVVPEIHFNMNFTSTLLPISVKFPNRQCLHMTQFEGVLAVT